MINQGVNAPTGRTPLPLSPPVVTAQSIREQTVIATTIVACTVIVMKDCGIMLCAESTPPLTRWLPPTKGNATPTR